MSDGKPSTEARAYEAADALLLEFGSLDAVTLAEVVRRVGGRKQNVARVFNRWRTDREMMAARLPRAALRAAHRLARDLLLILTLDAAPAPPARRAEVDKEIDASEARAAAGPAELRRSPGGGARRGSAPATPVARPTPAAAAGSLAQRAPPSERAERRTFLAGYAERVAARNAKEAVNRKPPDAPKRKPAPAPSPRPRRAPTPRRYARAPELPAAQGARRERMRAYVMHGFWEREAADPPVVPSDWENAARPKVARAAAIELRAARRPMTAKALVDTGRMPLTTNRPYRHLAAALTGSQIAPVAGSGGRYWFSYEAPPRRKWSWSSDDTDAKLAREFGRLLRVRLVVAIAVSPSPLARRDIAASLEPELADLSPVWLDQCLKRGKKQGALETRDGGYVMARPRTAAGKAGGRARASPAARGARV